MVVSKKRCVAMLLAGGQGSRLGVLTKYRAKPAVPFGGKYKIIDFPLSNCANSGIDTVGVLTQYEPLELNTYIGTGASWDLDSNTGGAFVLPPYMSVSSGEWYSGTANAIFQNTYFVDRYDPEFLLVLSGDHIYKMDYNRMIQFHVDNAADVTIAVLRVPLADAPRFGIINTDKDLRIKEFEEKPEHPKSDLASMGIYVFNWRKIKSYMKEDDQNHASVHDFGKNVLPAMLAGGERMFAYPFDGYWKDVGTADSLWEANMELLADEPQIEPGDASWKIYARSVHMPPHFLGESAHVVSSLISEGCEIYGQVEHSVLSPGVVVRPGALVRDSVIMQDTVIGENCRVVHSIIDENAQLGRGVLVGGGEHLTMIGSNATLEDGVIVQSGRQIEPHQTLSAKGGN